jgi:hypothetical protein
MTAPRVFISHASEDKERFVIPFATALRALGIDAWVDRWEMKIGDSLVDKIFEEGLKDTDVVIIVLSPTSIVKPWVREELNAAVVSRIQNGTRIVPLVLDACEVPGALRHILWHAISDPSSFGEDLNKVADVILGRSSKPPLGSAPLYFSAAALHSVGGLTPADNAVLAALYQSFLIGARSLVDPQWLVAELGKQGLDATLVSESMEVLEQQGYIELSKNIGRGPYHSRIALFGVSAMLGGADAQLIHKVGLCVVNEKLMNADQIGTSIEHPIPLVEYAIRRLEDAGHLIASKSIGGPAQIALVRPTLNRFIAEH